MTSFRSLRTKPLVVYPVHETGACGMKGPFLFTLLQGKGFLNSLYLLYSALWLVSRISSRYPDSYHHLHRVCNMGPSHRNFRGHLVRPMHRAPFETKCDVGELLHHDLQFVD